VAHAKGSVFLADREYIVDRYGLDGWNRALLRLNAADREVLGSLVAVGWYELSLHHRLNRAVFDELSQMDPRVLEHMARSSAGQHLTRIHRVFLSMANPAYVLEKAGQYWSRFYDSGEWRVYRLPNGADAELVGLSLPDELMCRAVTAYVQRLFELVGARSPSVHHPTCRARGDAVCLFRVRYLA
jgi:hypothetical protein